MQRFYCEEYRQTCYEEKYSTRGRVTYVMDRCSRMTILDVAEHSGGFSNWTEIDRREVAGDPESLHY